MRLYHRRILPVGIQGIANVVIISCSFNEKVPSDSGSGAKTSQRYVMGDSQQFKRQPISSTKGHYLSHSENVTVDITRNIILIMHDGYSDSVFLWSRRGCKYGILYWCRMQGTPGCMLTNDGRQCSILPLLEIS